MVEFIRSARFGNVVVDLDPQLFGDGWKMDEIDVRAHDLPAFSLSEVQLINCLAGDDYISGEEHLARMKSSHPEKVRLFAPWFMFGKDVPAAKLPGSWAGKMRGIMHVFFDGVVLKSREGRRCTPFVTFGGTKMTAGLYGLTTSRGRDSFSAVYVPRS